MVQHKKGKEMPQFKAALQFEKEFQDKYNKGLGKVIAQVCKMMINIKSKENGTTI